MTDMNKKQALAAKTASLVNGKLQCDQDRACKEPVTHIDKKGYVYCTKHGEQRKSVHPTRKLKPAEIARLEEGQPLLRYAFDDGIMTDVKTKQALAAKLLRVAKTDPTKRAAIMPLLQKMGFDTSKLAQEKVAGKDTEEFGRWVLSTQPVMSAHEVEAVVSRSLGVKTSPPVKARTGPRFQNGDKVIVCAEKHSGPGKGTYDLYDQKVGTCVGDDGMDLMLAFPGESAPVRFENGMKPRGVGVYKYTAAHAISGSAAMEMYYFAGGKPTEDAKIIVDAYIGRGGKTEQRSANYYTGHVVFASVGEKGYYFRGFPQQRIQVGSTGCKGDTFLPRTFNPIIGDIYYIGVLGHRPAKWKDEIAQLDKEAGKGAGDSAAA